MATIVTSASDLIPEEIIEVLDDIGIPQNLLGYNYMAYAIHLVVHDPNVANYITKVLYPRVAEEFHTTSSRVERALRHALEKPYDNDVLAKYFGNSIPYTGLTNSQFICTVANYVRRKLLNKVAEKVTT